MSLFWDIPHRNQEEAKCFLKADSLAGNWFGCLKQQRESRETRGYFHDEKRNIKQYGFISPGIIKCFHEFCSPSDAGMLHAFEKQTKKSLTLHELYIYLKNKNATKWGLERISRNKVNFRCNC